MEERYRKWGRVVRYEGGYLVEITEAGEAVEDGRRFRCGPIADTVPLPEIDRKEVETVVNAIRAAVSHPLSIERLLVSEGVAEHEFEGERWSERSRRIHLSIASGARRAIIDLAEFDVSGLSSIIEAFARCGAVRDSPARLILEPPLTAALLPSLIGVAPPNVRLLQSAGGRDGKGKTIEEAEVGVPPWPNWYRPSYRARPLRAPHNLRLSCDVAQIDENLPRAVALLAPVDGLLLQVLCVDGSAAYPAAVRVARIDAAGPPVRRYPYAAGSFGAYLML
jgi:hypothetical protein